MTILNRIVDTAVQEFSDVGSVEEATRLILRLALAGVLGGLLGIERETKGKAAGVRTHMLVAMGAAMFVVASDLFTIGPADMSRVLQGVIAGVGFLGAGTILKAGSEAQVKGLTTAAGIWMTAAIGVAAGMGEESAAILATLLALLIMAIVPMVMKAFESRDGLAARNRGGED
ncbi:Mg(2+) transporter [Pseudorhodoferax aquiterrae]|uniref:Protein MgtC n=1 Tax=Pseudorhodoferax aquiterrae TaxID=747304 RepID=A0ABQ3G8F7_9BURK|nr:MgtC/SapB family protein [Pseudorhodoferax aquiterrae]GHC92965.1 Mg(2+) transporter [Pseudorhodoferax aquiterrae]